MTPLGSKRLDLELAWRWGVSMLPPRKPGCVCLDYWDMCEISPEITSHTLDVNPWCLSVKQKRRSLSSKRSPALKEEAGKLKTNTSSAMLYTLNGCRIQCWSIIQTKNGKDASAIQTWLKRAKRTAARYQRLTNLWTQLLDMSCYHIWMVTPVTIMYQCMFQIKSTVVASLILDYIATVSCHLIWRMQELPTRNW